jgi:hypothetical protein
MWSFFNGPLFLLLGSNAFKYTFCGGVTVRLFSEKKEEREGVVLEVSDTGVLSNISYSVSNLWTCNWFEWFLGVGIPEQHLSSIFQRFYRIRSQQARNQEGTGIGLALVKDLVARHDGDISVKSQENVGTTFSVWIPAGFDHLPMQQVHFSIDKDLSSPEADHESQIYSNTDMDTYGECSMSNEPERYSLMQLDDDNLYSKSLPKLDRSSALHMDLNYAEFENKKESILVVDDNPDMRFVSAKVICCYILLNV